MLILNGRNLGERQKELNAKINEATFNTSDFGDIKNKTEYSDIDKLFKIALASKYRNIEYMVDVLKAGDPLHISLVLKCSWMFDDDFSHIFNVNYLSENIFPFMSRHMKNKLLTTLSTCIRNEERAIAFCNYCMNKNLTNTAQKFLMSTSESFKLDFLHNNANIMSKLRKRNYLKHFVGNSFTVADAYLSTLAKEPCKLKAFTDINYLYSVSDAQYLELLEKYLSLCDARNIHRLGLKISKDIITKHKNRILKKPQLYINFLNKTSTVRHTSPETAKIYVIALLPEEVNDFWYTYFCDSYEFILNILPADTQFGFLNEIFTEKYPHQPFEMDERFCFQEYFRFMTLEQKERWALDQITSKSEILGKGKEYQWYKYFSFQRALSEIKHLVRAPTNNLSLHEIMDILLESARSQRDLTELLIYFYDMYHIIYNNNGRYMVEKFMDQIAAKHNIFEFDMRCWAAVNNIYLAVLNVYSVSDSKTHLRKDYKIIALIYNVIHNKSIHDALKLYISDAIDFSALKRNTNKLTPEKQEKVYKYLYNFYIDNIKEFLSVPNTCEVKSKLRKCINIFLSLLHQYKRTKKDIPEVVTNFIKLDWDNFKGHPLYYEALKQDEMLTQAVLMRLLKKDANLVVTNLPLLKKSIQIAKNNRFGHFLGKIKVYFCNDILNELFEVYKELLKADEITPREARTACYGIFQLADDSFKNDFILKHVPSQNSFNRNDMYDSLLNIQKAICATAFHSRPPVLLKHMLMYLKGDYVPCCLPIFDSYLAHLPFPLCKELLEAILNNPLPIQKHGLRLAFAYFDIDDLWKFIVDSWEKYTNLSFRQIIFKAMCAKIAKEDQKADTALFETLKIFTLELLQLEHKEVYDLLTSVRLPKPIMSDYVNIIWTAVCALPINTLTLEKRADVIHYMSSNVRLIRQDFIRPIVEDFTSIKHCNSPKLNQSSWDLKANYIMYVQDEDDLKFKLELTKLILSTTCLNNFNLSDQDIFKIKSHNTLFIRQLLRLSFLHNLESYEYINTIFETILEMLDLLPSEDTYINIWAIRINLATRKGLFKINTKLSAVDDESKDEKRSIIRSHGISLGKDIGNLIKEYMDKDMYFKSLAPDVQNIFIEETQTMIGYIKKIDVNAHDLLVVTSLGLIALKASEMYLFALNILPVDYRGQYGEEYFTVLQDIKKCDNLEVKCKMHDKFTKMGWQFLYL